MQKHKEFDIFIGLVAVSGLLVGCAVPVMRETPELLIPTPTGFNLTETDNDTIQRAQTKTLPPVPLATIEPSKTVTPLPLPTPTPPIEKVNDQDAEKIRAGMPDFYRFDPAKNDFVKSDKSGFTFEVVDTTNLIIRDKTGKMVGWAEHFYMVGVEKSYFYMITDNSETAQIPIELATKANKFQTGSSLPLQLVHGFVENGLALVNSINTTTAIENTKKYAGEALKVKNGEDNFQTAILRWLAVKNNTTESDILANLDRRYNIAGVEWVPSKGMTIVWTDVASAGGGESNNSVYLDNSGRLILKVSAVANLYGNEGTSLSSRFSGLAYNDCQKNTDVSIYVSSVLTPRRDLNTSLASYVTKVLK